MFRLKTLGALALEGPDGALGGAASQRRTLALLALLAAAGDKGVSRERLTGVLWPDSDEDRARHVLAQMVYRVRQQLGDEVIEGTTTLRLNVHVLGSDVLEFERALARSEWESAARAYAGAFLDGFYLPDAPEFERWVESERARLAQRYAGALDRLAKDARARGDPAGVLEWSRARAAIDPLDARAATQLLEDLATAGDRPAALQYARVYEALLREQLDTEPPAEFIQVVARLRSAPTMPPAPARASDFHADPTNTIHRPDKLGLSTSNQVVVDPPATIGEAGRPTPRAASFFSRATNRYLVGAIAVTILLFAGVSLALLKDAGEIAARRTIAVGHIDDYTGDTLGAGRAVPELLSTNLSRLERLDVIGRSRLLDLIARLDGEKPDARGVARAAEEAGAAELVDGALYRAPDGALRLDVRVLDLRTGIVRAVHQVTARDAFALTDTATVRLAGAFGVPAPEHLRVTDVTTSSPVAYRFYEEGLRALQQHDLDAAIRLFTTALAIDSTFAMAAYGLSRVHNDRPDVNAERTWLDRALRLRHNATERERLLIEAMWAHEHDYPSRVPLARRLTARYPSDPEAHLTLGKALHWQGDFAGAIIAFRQTLALDSSSLRSDSPRCYACQAVSGIAMTYGFMDSLAVAAQYARFLADNRPTWPTSWLALRETELQSGDFEGAIAADRRRQELLARDEDPLFSARVAMKRGDFAGADTILRSFAISGSQAIRDDALWWLTISRRYQGRMEDALSSIRPLRHILHEAQVLLEARRLDEAVRASTWRRDPGAPRGDPNPAYARHITWALLHHASALAENGDTTRLEAIADSMEAIGRFSGYGRDPLLHHHVRALLFRARGQRLDAVREFRSAIWSTTAGYTRTNFELGRLLIELGRAEEAIPLLQAALRNDGQASGLYITYTELHALLARAFAETGPADSARVHRDWALRAWRYADANVRDRIPQLLNLQRKP